MPERKMWTELTYSHLLKSITDFGPVVTDPHNSLANWIAASKRMHTWIMQRILPWTTCDHSVTAKSNRKQERTTFRSSNWPAHIRIFIVHLNRVSAENLKFVLAIFGRFFLRHFSFSIYRFGCSASIICKYIIFVHAVDGTNAVNHFETFKLPTKWSMRCGDGA